MNKLNDDMQKSIDELDLINDDKKFIEKILYLERINKTKEWTADAVKEIKELLGEVNTDAIND